MSSLVFSPLRIVGGTAVGVGVGQSVADAISPITRELANEAWARYLSMPISAVEAAQLVVSGERSRSWGAAEATKNGIDGERFDALCDVIDTAPDLSTLYQLYWRGFISEGDFREGAKKANIEDKWMDALVRLAERVLSPAEAANAWQQGFMSEAEATAEAEKSGVSPHRSQIQRELAGLPPGVMDSLQLLRRGIIDEATYAQIVREGHTKTKYTEALLALRNRILNQTDAANLWLRGWITEAQAKAIGVLNGYDGEAMDLLYKNRGRPATVRQAHVGFARGGRLPGAGDNEEETLRRSVQESNIRTEWFDILYAQRFTYPSAFVIRALATDGTLNATQTRQILLESGWRPDYAQLAADNWAGADDAPKTPWANKARSRLFTVTHDEYQDQSIDEPTARTMLTDIGIGTGEQNAIVRFWNLEQSISRLELTPTQIKKAYYKGKYDLPTALAELAERGMTTDDATIFLES